MDETVRRRPADLRSRIAATVLPLAVAGDPGAGQMLKCLTCEDTSQRCGDCWERVRQHRAAEALLAPKRPGG